MGGVRMIGREDVIVRYSVKICYLPPLCPSDE